MRGPFPVSTNARAIPDAIQWHEGMMLGPQHFQQASRRSEAQLAYHVLASSPYAWGLRHMALDERILLDGVFRIDELEAIMPDGLLALHPMPQEPTLRLEIDLKALSVDLVSAPVTVHLGVVAHNEQAARSGTAQRYRSVEAEPTVDENTGDGEISIPRLRPQLNLLVSESPSRPPPNLYVSMPIAQVQMVGEAPRLTLFAPPHLCVGRSSALRSLVETIAKSMRDKAISLADRLQDVDGGDDRGAAGDGWAVVRALMLSLPKIEVLLDSETAHPFVLYLALCDAVGALAGLERQPYPPQLPVYRHDDPLPCFQHVAQLVGRVIDRLRDPYQLVRFVRQDDAFCLRLKPQWLSDGELLIGMKPRPSHSPVATAAWLEGAWISAASRLASVQARRILGAQRTVVDDETTLPFTPGRNVTLFHIKVEPDFIQGGEDLLIATPLGEDAPGFPLEIILYVAPDAEGEATEPEAL